MGMIPLGPYRSLKPGTRDWAVRVARKILANAVSEAHEQRTLRPSIYFEECGQRHHVSSQFAPFFDEADWCLQLRQILHLHCKYGPTLARYAASQVALMRQQKQLAQAQRDWPGVLRQLLLRTRSPYFAYVSKHPTQEVGITAPAPWTASLVAVFMTPAEVVGVGAAMSQVEGQAVAFRRMVDIKAATAWRLAANWYTQLWLPPMS